MTHVDVPAHWVFTGQMGPLCARHGIATDRALRRTFYTRTPSWVYLLLVTGVLLMVIVATALRKTVQGVVPGCQRCADERRRALTLGWAAVALVPVLFVVAAAVSSVTLLVLAALAVPAAVVAMMLVERRRVTGVLSKDQQTVTLKGVAPQFADAARAAATPALAPPYGTVLPYP
jgi:hypothetical protein